MSDLRERLAAVEHERWARWQRWMHGACRRNDDGSLTIPAELVQRWERQIATPYADLSEREKDSDREQVDQALPEIAAWLHDEAALRTKMTESEDIATVRTLLHVKADTLTNLAASLARPGHTEEEERDG